MLLPIRTAPERGYTSALPGAERQPPVDIISCLGVAVKASVFALAVKQEDMLQLLLGAAYAAGIAAADNVAQSLGQLNVLFLGDDAVFYNINGNMGADVANNVKINVKAAVYLDNVLAAHNLTGGVLDKGNRAVQSVKLQQLIELHCLTGGNVVNNDTVYNAVYLHISTSRSFMIRAMRMNLPF